MKTSGSLCVACKGSRSLCGASPCPILQKIKILEPLEGQMKKEVFGPTPPNLFVGYYGYPNVSWGPMVSISDSIDDNPAEWYGLGLDEIVRRRSSLIRSKTMGNVFSNSRFLQETQEAVLSTSAIDVEAKFTHEPKFKVSFSSVTQPMGPMAPLEDFKVCENPKIPRKVDEIIDEKLKAVPAVTELFEDGFDVYYLTKLLSAGVLGKVKKRMVPTRWSITAVDDMLGKQIINEIKEFSELNEFLVFSNEYLFNHFEILLIPGKWEYEQFEAWSPGTVWSKDAKNVHIEHDHEPFWGRTTYASEAGGYYAGRFSTCEALLKMRRQARVIVFREIYEGYVIPVGVWEVRENVRKAFEKPARKFNSLDEALVHISSRLRIPISEYKKKSKVISQRRLTDYQISTCAPDY